MRKYEKKEVPVIQDILVEMKCDTCDKEINSGDVYYKIRTSHHDWGEHSSDSWEYKDACSPECVTKEMQKYFDFDSSTKEIEIDIQKRS